MAAKRRARNGCPFPLTALDKVTSSNGWLRLTPRLSRSRFVGQVEWNCECFAATALRLAIPPNEPVQRKGLDVTY
ncbi:hypothetical protein BDP81DRAFT_424988 [Colletotrichum phormii]|uniref:Uncharacterized protein n=1 Tax=Colletotrichum phormii TaxID=359342 RepID=A0AAI9ZUK9_9PEZI|nr:uncharacterized protein BDP81DRAFT_424988 [Colletotrichum phormii]KAK1638446.1 hypothetical protein BDP81DRAFT_424988 [Colletotrichum phormii]